MHLLYRSLNKETYRYQKDEIVELTSWGYLIGFYAALILMGFALRSILTVRSPDPAVVAPRADPDVEKPLTEEDRGKHFPWSHVRQCYDRKVEPMNGSSCPSCNLPGNQLLWIDFVSPPCTWKNLCGRQGYLSICEKCHVQIDFWMTGMN